MLRRIPSGCTTIFMGVLIIGFYEALALISVIAWFMTALFKKVRGNAG